MENLNNTNNSNDNTNKEKNVSNLSLYKDFLINDKDGQLLFMFTVLFLIIFIVLFHFNEYNAGIIFAGLFSLCVIINIALLISIFNKK